MIIMEPVEAYEKLLGRVKELTVLGGIRSSLAWDSRTYMPKKAVAMRGDQQGWLAGVFHEKITDPEIGEWLSTIEGSIETFDEVQKRNVFLMRRTYDRITKIPKEHQIALTMQTNKAQRVWEDAKEQGDFSLFQPELEKVVELVKKSAHYIDPDKPAYDVMLDTFERNLTEEEVSRIFGELKPHLIELVQKCQNSSVKPNQEVLHHKVPKHLQRKLSYDLADLVGYDMDRGSIDEAEHPFTIGYYDDVRITTHFYENRFASSFFSVMHEAGHGIYEQNQSRDFLYQPVGGMASMGVHESQSRFLENIVGRSEEFWQFYWNKFQEITGYPDVDFSEFLLAINTVENTKIRVEADEVTYGLHVIVRFEIERELMKGNIQVADLPKVWNEKINEYLGVDVQNDAEGVLQDIHWSSGQFGYFPTYSLGNIYASQLHKKMMEDLDVPQLIKEGKIKDILAWMDTHIHKKGALMDPVDLIRDVTGEDINIQHYVDYLNQKYGKLYGF